LNTTRGLQKENEYSEKLELRVDSSIVDYTQRMKIPLEKNMERERGRERERERGPSNIERTLPGCSSSPSNTSRHAFPCAGFGLCRVWLLNSVTLVFSCITNSTATLQMQEKNEFCDPGNDILESLAWQKF